jgi:hypothetical protein
VITIEQEQSIAATISRMGGLSKGVGTKERACSVAAINLALNGRLTDEIPACMSPVIGKWIITVQDAMPETLRNSAEWRRLLPLAAGTGREHEGRRIELIIDWMWGTVLQSHQPHADAGGYGAKWRAMLEKRTEAATAAEAAAAAALALAWAARAAACAAAEAAEAAARDAARAAAWYAARDAARDAARAARAAARDAAWESFAPADLLAKLVAVTDGRALAAKEGE